MKSRFVLLLFVCVIFTALSAWAQGGQVTVGTVQVTVEDATGAVIPGAKVIMSSSMGSRTVTTDERGIALFGGVIPGLWTIRAEVAGFKAAEAKDVDVRINVRTPVILVMEPGDVTQVVEVSAAAIAIDPTSTNLTASHNDTLYNTIPIGRNLTNTFYLGVGVNDGGGTGFANPSISGGSGLENLYVLDGVNITNTGFGAYGTYHRVFGPIGSGVTTSFIQEVQVTTGGFEANYGQALGGVINVTTKSGSNDWHGAVYVYVDPETLSVGRRQINDFRLASGTEVHAVDEYDFGVEAGGYIMKDRLFWFGSFNPVLRRVEMAAPSGFPYAGDCVAGVTAGICHPLGHIDSRRRTMNYAMKLTGVINPNHTVEATWYGDPSIWSFGPTTGATRGEGGRGMVGTPTIVGGAVTPRDFSRLDFSGLNWAIRYNGSFSPKWVLNAHIAQAHNRFAEERFFNDYGITDRTGAVTGNPGIPIGQGGIGFFENYKADTKQFYLNSAHQYKLIGPHEIQVGFQFETAAWDVLARRSGPDFPVPTDPITLAAGVAGLPTAGATGTARPCLERTGLADCGAGLPVFARPGGQLPSAYYFQISRGAFAGSLVDTRTRYGALYASDTWSITDRINIKLGLRWEQENMNGPATCVESVNVPTCHYAFTGNWAPRLGVTVDPMGNRKSKAYLHFGRIFERIPLDLAQRSLGSEASYLTMIYGATSINPFTGEPVFNPNGGSVYLPAFAAINCPAGTAAVLCTSTGGVREPNPFLTGNFGTLIFPGTKQQFLDEFVLGYEQELPHGFFVRTRYLDRRIKRIVEDTSPLTVEAANFGLNQQYVIANVNTNADLGTNPACGALALPGQTVFSGCIASPGPDALFGTDDDIYSFLANPLAGLAIPDGIPDGFPNPARNHQAVEGSPERPPRDNWQMFINWRIAKLFGNFEGSFRNDNGQEDPNISSLYDFTGSVRLAEQFQAGPLPTDRLHIVNFYGSYMINSGWANNLNIGGNLRVESGSPISKFLHHPAYFNAGEIPSGGRGSQGKTRVQGVFDLHFDYPWKITERFTLRGALDFFNLFNAERITSVDQFAEIGGGGVNPDFLTPVAFQRPFHTRFALRFEW